MSKLDYHWTFGAGCHIEFPGGGDPVLALDHGFSSNEGCATISDSNGNLLFYTDGASLYDSAHSLIGPLGGTSNACNSAIIIPPAGGGSLYHIFTVGDWDSSANIKPLHHSTVQVSGGVTLNSGPTDLNAFGPKRTAEKLAATSHADCDKYWLVSVDIDAGRSGAGALHAMLIDSDLAPTASISTPYPYSTFWGFCAKFSPDGMLLAVVSESTIDILNFDRATGVFTKHSQVTNCDTPYGVEFSPNGQHLYFTSYKLGYVNRCTIGSSGSTPGPVANVAGWIDEREPEGATLQLAPNGKIYGTKRGQTTLFEIGDPDNPAATAAGVQFKEVASQAGGGALMLNQPAQLGLPVFPRTASDCLGDRCKLIATRVNSQLMTNARALQNHMITCTGEAPREPRCEPLDIPEIGPQTYISWGNSECDCIEGDDTEIMHLTICNPYSNLTLSRLTVNELVVVDDEGQPVPALPDGSPSIQLVPVGPYCFDDVAPCTCVSREFMLRLRGAPGARRYRILVRGICFDACFHGDTEACFAFDVCRD